MASKVIFDDLSLLTEEQRALLDSLRDEPLAEKCPEEEEKGWFVSHSEQLVDGIKAIPQLATSLVYLLKNRYSHVYIERENTGGNFCGHDPANPSFVMQNHPYFIPAETDDLGNKRRPQILYDIVERIKAYYHNPDVMPVLQNANADKRSSTRKRRSEARERLVNLLTVMIMNMDLGSLRVGQPTKEGGFFNYSVEWLAKKAKLTLSRAKRAMSDLNDAVIIHSYQYRELVNEEKKEYIAHNASRVFDREFFRMLDIDIQKLGKARKLANKKQQDKQAAHQSELSAKDDAVLKLNMKKVMRGIDDHKQPLNKLNTAENEAETAKKARLHKRRTEVFLELSSDPRFYGDEAALSAAVKQRLGELDLLNEQEKGVGEPFIA